MALAAVMAATTMASIGASASCAQQVVHMSTETAVAAVPVQSSVLGTVAVTAGAKVLAGTAAKKVISHFLGMAGEAAGCALLNKGAEFFLKWAISNWGDSKKEPTIKDVLPSSTAASTASTARAA